MTKGEAARVVESYREVLRETLSRFDDAGLLRLRGELQVAARWLLDRGDAPRAEAAEKALRAISGLYQYTLGIRGFTGSRKAAETASMFDLGAIGVLALENVLTAERKKAVRLLMSGLAEGLMFLASRQYVRGSSSVLDATYRTHAIDLRDELWTLAMESREKEGLEDLRGARATVDEMFLRLEDPAVPDAAKIAALEMLYTLLVLVRCVQFLETLESRK